MRNRAVLVVVACVSVACADGDGDRPSPLGVVTDVFVSPALSPPVAPGVYTDSSQPSDGSYASNPLAISGHLEGQLRNIQLSGETTSNSGSLEVYPGSPAYLYASVAMEGAPTGAGMIILNITGGMAHPVFTEGTWSMERELAAQSSPTFTGTEAISVGSCAGPALGEYPYEQQAVDYDMSVAEDPEEPGTVVVVVGANFHVDDYGTQTSDVAATIRFRPPEP